MPTSSYAYDSDLHSQSSADRIVARILEFTQVSSVSDFGCGKGQFLLAFQNKGVTKLYGYDGPWAKEAFLNSLDPSILNVVDFEYSSEIVAPHTDVSLSLEVAEHISPSHSEDFVALLCATSDIVVFSAAIKDQQGQGHINEQPLSYWIKKFEKHGFEFFDILRPLIWDDTDIEVWYRQNICLFAKPEKLPLEFSNRLKCLNAPTDIVHPELYSARIAEYKRDLEDLYNGNIRPVSYLYLFLKSVARIFTRGANE